MLSTRIVSCLYQVVPVRKLAPASRQCVNAGLRPLEATLTCFLQFFGRIHNAGRMATQKAIATSAKPSP